MVQAVGGGQCFGQDGSQPGVVVLGEAGLQGELETGEGGAQLVGGVGGEVAFVAQEFGEAVQHLVVGAGDLIDLGDVLWAARAFRSPSVTARQWRDSSSNGAARTRA